MEPYSGLGPGDTSPASTPRFVAFISYSHTDGAVARWLHGALEKFPVPAHLRTHPAQKGIGKVFRDEAELASSASLSAAITQALADSSALIVIASRASARSYWVDQEILEFKRLGRADRIFCLIVDGEPFASERGQSDQECFPLALRRSFDSQQGITEPRQEPLGVDLRKDGKRNALLRIAAGLLGVGFDALKRREQRRRQAQLLVVSIASVVGMAITSALAFTAYRAEQGARRQQQIAEREAKIARETTSFVVSLFQTADPFRTRGESITAREVLDAGLVRIRSAFQDAPEIRASLLGSMGEVYQGLGLYKTSSELFAELQSQTLVNALDPLGRLRFLNSFAETSFNIGDYAKAQELMEDAQPLLLQNSTVGDPVERGRTRNIAAELAMHKGDAQGADQWLAQNLQALGDETRQDTRLQRALSYFNQGQLRLQRRELVEARQAFEKSQGLRVEVLGRDHPWVAEIDNAVASIDYDEGKYAQAEQRWKSVLPKFHKYFGENHPEYSSVLQNYALTLLERGNFQEAEQWFVQTLKIDQKDKAPDHDDLAYSLNSLGLVQIGLGQFGKAKAYLDQGIVIARKHRHRMRLPLLMNRADLACRQRDFQAAAAWLFEARSALEEDFKGVKWREAQLDNVDFYCQAMMVRKGSFVPERLLASYAVIRKQWGADRLYTTEARWRVLQAFSIRGHPAPAMP